MFGIAGLRKVIGEVGQVEKETIGRVGKEKEKEKEKGTCSRAARSTAQWPILRLALWQ